MDTLSKGLRTASRAWLMYVVIACVAAGYVVQRVSQADTGWTHDRCAALADGAGVAQRTAWGATYLVLALAIVATVVAFFWLTGQRTWTDRKLWLREVAIPWLFWVAICALLAALRHPIPGAQLIAVDKCLDGSDNHAVTLALVVIHHMLVLGIVSLVLLAQQAVAHVRAADTAVARSAAITRELDALAALALTGGALADAAAKRDALAGATGAAPSPAVAKALDAGIAAASTAVGALTDGDRALLSVDHWLDIRLHLRCVLFLGSLLLVTGVLQIGTLYDFLGVLGGEQLHELSSAFVVAAGIGTSLLLAVTYVPALIVFRRRVLVAFPDDQRRTQVLGDEESIGGVARFVLKIALVAAPALATQPWAQSVVDYLGGSH